MSSKRTILEFCGRILIEKQLGIVEVIKTCNLRKNKQVMKRNKDQLFVEKFKQKDTLIDDAFGRRM